MVNKKSNKPYILEIKKMKKNEELLKNHNYLKINKDFSPISGSESKYEPKKWNKKGIKETHNCYSYALGKIIPKLSSKAQPGYASGFNIINNNDYECEKFSKRLKKDSPGSYLEKFDNACLPGFYKIFLALDVNNDYHWYKQHIDGYWSHKPGSTNVTDKDAKGNRIKNPLLSDRNFNHRNYYKPCFFSCIYSDLSRSLNNIYNIH
jgi:hypothetical protein